MTKEKILQDLLNSTDSAKFITSFEKELEIDDQPFEKKGDYLISKYSIGTDIERNVIDDVLIILCGCSLQTLCSKTNE